MNILEKKDDFEVLMVEDSPADTLLITEAFKDNGIPCNLNIVGDGEQALDYLNREGKYINAAIPDIILLDLNLPRMDGLTFLRRVKSENLFKSIPVIVLTSSRSDLDIRDVWAMNASCYIIKPSNLDEYTDVVKKIQTFWLTLVQLPTKQSTAV